MQVSPQQISQHANYCSIPAYPDQVQCSLACMLHISTSKPPGPGNVPNPIDVIDKYDMKELADDEWVYIKIQKDMYWLKQAGILAKKLLSAHLDNQGY